MTIDINEYKKNHKSADQIELERREMILDNALEEFDQAINQFELKYNNLPPGTNASLDDVDYVLGKMFATSYASCDFKEQQRKMGLRPWENETEEQKRNKLVRISDQ